MLYCKLMDELYGIHYYSLCIQLSLIDDGGSGGKQSHGGR